MLRRTPLARTTSLAPRKKRMPQQSPKGRAGKAAQRQAYAAAPTSDCCEVCKRFGPVEHSHLFTQKQLPAQRLNPLNWLLKCRACHTLWEDNKRAFAARYPDAWQQILTQMQQVDKQAFAFFRMKHDF